MKGTAIPAKLTWFTPDGSRLLWAVIGNKPCECAFMQDWLRASVVLHWRAIGPWRPVTDERSDFIKFSIHFRNPLIFNIILLVIFIEKIPISVYNPKSQFFVAWGETHPAKIKKLKSRSWSQEVTDMSCFFSSQRTINCSMLWNQNSYRSEMFLSYSSSSQGFFYIKRRRRKRSSPTNFGFRLWPPARMA